jgi:hypothetical protein
VLLKRLWWRVTGHWKAIPTHKWKSTLTCHWNVYSNMSLKKLWWWVTGHWKGYPDMSLKRLLWCITEKSTLMCHWKDFGDEWWVTKKDSLDTSLKSVLWRDGLEIHHLDSIERPSQAPLVRPRAITRARAPPVRPTTKPARLSPARWTDRATWSVRQLCPD